MIRIVSLILTVMLTACGGQLNVEKFYNSTIDRDSFENSGKYIIHKGKPELFYIDGQDILALRVEQFEYGYSMLGMASFSGANRDIEQSVLAYGEKIGAARIIYFKEYTHTKSGTFSITTPTSQTSYSSGTVMGSGYMGTYSGSTTVYGTQTTEVPYSRDIYDYDVLFFVKNSPGGWGLAFVTPTVDTRARNGRNAGVEVVAIEGGGSRFQRGHFNWRPRSPSRSLSNSRDGRFLPIQPNVLWKRG
jgi:hypothetical protein